MLARQLGVSRTIVHRVWTRHDVQPHRVERFKISKNPHFEEKVRDIVGLYLTPPVRALVAAFNILNGKVIGACQARHRSREFIRFLNLLEKEPPTDQEVHLILDNYRTHKSAAVKKWLKPKKRSRFHFHYTPTSSSWLNQVERFFALITGRDDSPGNLPQHR